MLKRPQYIALSTVVLMTIVLLKLPSRAQANLKLAISGGFLPFFGVAGSAGQLADSSSYVALSREQLIQQIEALQQTNQLWQMRLMQAEEWRKENDRLRQQLGFARQSPWNLKPARVVARDLANWWRTVRIDRGSRDGVVTNAPVLTVQGTALGLVGRVSQVGYAQSQVVLVGDPDCRVSVLIGDPRSREQGVIAPASSSPSDDALVELSYISRNSRLAAGQIVVTSGQGGVFPAGIVVGQIADFRTVGYGLYKEARVSLAVKMNTLEEVWVLMP